MNRTGLLIALSVAATVGLVFGLYPNLDLAIAAPFFDNREFWFRFNPITEGLRDFSRIAVTIVVAPAVIAVLGKLILPQRRMLIPGRAAVLMIVTLALGPGLAANVVLKSHWGRPRPIDVAEFGGDQHFVPWWDLRGDCPDNCSFVAGEPSGAFWTLAPAALVPPAWRALATAGALAFGTVIGVVRMVAGGHFFTDVVFSGVLIFLIIWLAHGIIYRWPTTRMSDRTIESALELLALRWRGVGRSRQTLAPSEPTARPQAPLRPGAAEESG